MKLRYVCIELQGTKGMIITEMPPPEFDNFISLLPSFLLKLKKIKSLRCRIKRSKNCVQKFSVAYQFRVFSSISLFTLYGGYYTIFIWFVKHFPLPVLL